MNTRMQGSQSTGGRLAERAFRQGDVPVVRQFTEVFGRRACLAPARLADFVLAVSEAAACATAAGPCTARVRLWVSGRRAFCEVRGDGLLLRRTASAGWPGGRRGEEEAIRRCLLQQIADHVSVASGPDGVRVLLSMTVT
jgi:hypothetical protein